MKRTRLTIFPLLIFTLGSFALPPRAAPGSITQVGDQVSFEFPNSATFKSIFKSSAGITAVVLEYGVDQLTCGTVLGKAFPQFTPATEVSVAWTWDMRQTGSLAPGATIWWRWQVADASGGQFTSPRQTTIWLDNIHPWQVILGGNINLHYYSGGQAFGKALHDSAAQALVRLSEDVGLTVDQPVDIYIYANTDDLKAAILYEPAWTGGQAFAANNIVIIGVSPSELEWGKSTEAHELTHVLVGQLTFSCLGFIPTWLEEGLAMVGEGGLGGSAMMQFNQAISSNSLISLRSLAGGFSESSDRANLSYSESYSVVNFLILRYGRNKMTALLENLRNGATADEALYTVYGFDTDGLEDAWRASISAAPRVGSMNPTPVFTTTPVPTIIPVGAATPQQRTLAAYPTSAPPRFTPTQTPGSPAAAAPTIPWISQLGINSSLITGTGWVIACLCLLFLAFIVGAAIFILRQSRRNK